MELDFEGSMKRLEEIVELLEKGELTLEESLGLYEEGVRLARALSGYLKQAERRIEMLTLNEDEEPVLTPWEEDG